MSSPADLFWVKRIDNSRLVRQRDPSSVQECAALVGVAVICLLILLFCAWQHFTYIHLGYQLERLQAEHEQVLDWNRTLQLEQAALLDPGRIDLLARTQLGLEAPGVGQLLPLGSPEREAEGVIVAQAENAERRPHSLAAD